MLSVNMDPMSVANIARITKWNNTQTMYVPKHRDIAGHCRAIGLAERSSLKTMFKYVGLGRKPYNKCGSC